MQKPTLFIVDSDLIDINFLVLKLERNFSCRIYTFFGIEEILHYPELRPSVCIIDEHSFRMKKEVLDTVVNHLSGQTNLSEVKFLVYGNSQYTGLIPEASSGDMDNLDHVNIDYHYRSIQEGLNKVLQY